MIKELYYNTKTEPEVFLETFDQSFRTSQAVVFSYMSSEGSQGLL